MGRTVLWIALVVTAMVIVLKSLFDVDAIELAKGFLSWLFDLLWHNRV